VRDILEAALKKEKLSVIPAFEVNYMSTVIGLVRAGLGIAVLPAVAESIEVSGDITRLEITNPVLNRNVEIIEKKGRSPSHAASSMLDVLKRFTASLGECI
jgi:DNA-binding transcriptional LysR family regulator